MTLTKTKGFATSSKSATPPSQTTAVGDFAAIMDEMRKMLQSSESKGEHGKIRVGVSLGLLKYLVDKQEEKVATNFKTSWFSGSGYRFQVAEEIKTLEKSAIYVESLQKLANERASALEINISLTFVEIESLLTEMENGAEGVPYTYATFEVDLLNPLEGRKRIAKNTLGVEETKFFIKGGSVKFLGNIVQANNPLGDDSVLCSSDEFEKGILETMDKSRQGFNTWRDARNAAQESSPASAAEGPSISNLLGTITA